MRELAAREGAEVKIVPPRALREAPEVWGAAQAYLPMAVEPGYSAQEMLYIGNAVLFHGVKIKPVGARELWAQMVPAEMPELLNICPCSPDDDSWYKSLIPVMPSRTQTNTTPVCKVDAAGIYVINDTKVDTTMPNLAHPLATLNRSYIVPDVVIGPASPEDVVLPMYSEAPRPKSTLQNATDWRYMLIGGFAALVLVAVGIFIVFT